MKKKGIQAEEKFCTPMKKQEQAKMFQGVENAEDELDGGVGDDGTEPPVEKYALGVLKSCWQAGIWERQQTA